MKVGVVYNRAQVERDTASALAEKIEKVCKEAVLFTENEPFSDVERLIVLGGDGTMLHAAKQAASLQIPLVGVNFGRIGFLTEFERDELDDAVALVADPTCQILERTMLTVTFNGASADCLNELAILCPVTPARSTRVGRLSVTIDGSSTGEFAADGLIVATPTGSTAHSLSAGGSILMPDCATFLLTPVCAFSLKSRPIACPDRSVLRFAIPEGERLLAYGDGDFLGEIQSGDDLSVTRSSRSALFLTRNKHEFFRRITQKLN